METLGRVVGFRVAGFYFLLFLGDSGYLDLYSPVDCYMPGFRV